MKTYQHPDKKRRKQFWRKIWARRERNRKAESVNNMKKQIQELKEYSQTKIRLDSHREKLKKQQIGKRPAMIAYMDSGFKKFTPIHDRLAIIMNRFLQERDLPVCMNKGKTTQIQKKKKTPKRNGPLTTTDL